MLTSLTKGGGGLRQLLTITDKGPEGGRCSPPHMAAIICEQSLITEQKHKKKQLGSKVCPKYRPFDCNIQKI